MAGATRPRILCVDDEPAVLEALRDELRHEFDVTTASSGPEGLETLRNESFAVLVADMRMPEMDGTTFLALARERSPDSVRVLLTGHAEIETATTAINQGEIFRFLVKPCPRRTLLDALRAAAERHRQLVADAELLRRAFSAREQAEAALDLSEERFRRMFDGGVVSKAVVGLDGALLRVNGSLSDLLGYSREELQQMSLGELAPADSGALDLPGSGGEIATASRAIQIETPLRRHDGAEVWTLLNASLVRTEAGEPCYFLAELVDITERRRIEHRLKQIERLEIVGELAAGVAHDFNNLLTSINGYAQLAREQTNDPAIEADIAEIETAAGRAQGIARHLLSLSRDRQSAPQVIDPNAIVEESIGLLKPVIDHRVQLASSLEPALLPVEADPDELSQVVLNLAMNARDAMPDGGALRVETANVEARAAPVLDMPGSTSDAFVRLSVEDTGVGMDARTQARMFEPFFTTKEAGEGTGLGLATVARLVAASGGSMNVVSAPGEGTRIDVYLPAFVEAS